MPRLLKIKFNLSYFVSKWPTVCENYTCSRSPPAELQQIAGTMELKESESALLLLSMITGEHYQCNTDTRIIAHVK